MPLRAVILDFDGIVLESNQLKTLAFERIFGRFPDHAVHMLGYHHDHVSESRFKKFEYLVTHRLGRPSGDPLVAELAQAFSDEMMELIEQCPMVAGAAEFLEYVSRRVPIYLASMTPHAELERILDGRGLAKWFTAVYGCPPWTKRAAIQEVIGRYGSVGGLLFVGDSAGDQSAARDMGIEFLARDSGLSFEDPQPQTFPDMGAVLAAIETRFSI